MYTLNSNDARHLGTQKLGYSEPVSTPLRRLSDRDVAADGDRRRRSSEFSIRNSKNSTRRSRETPRFDAAGEARASVFARERARRGASDVRHFPYAASENVGRADRVSRRSREYAIKSRTRSRRSTAPDDDRPIRRSFAIRIRFRSCERERGSAERARSGLGPTRSTRSD